MTHLTKGDIKELVIDGWKCSEFGTLCTVLSHKEKVFKLIEDPALGAEFITKDENFSGREGNAIILHIGQVNANFDLIKETPEKLVIPAGAFVFFLTKEIINMPLNCDGTLFMNPATSNKGLLFFTLGHIDPGFSGYLTATLLNTTSRDIPLKRNEGVLYLVVSKLDKPSKPHAQYHEHPQLDIDQAMRDLSYNMKPGFALTTQDFATKKDLQYLKNLMWAAIGTAIGAVGVVIALLALFGFGAK